MKKTTQNNFSKRLAQYSALTVAIAGVADASGQTIVYTDIADTGGPGTVYQLDLDNNGTIDFVIGNFGASNQIQLIAPAVSYIPYTTSAAPYGFQGFNGNGILGSSASSGDYLYPFALNNGDVINSAQATWNTQSNFQTMNWASCYYSGSNWCDSTDKFLGLRFDIDGSTHYGWARLDVPLSPGAWLIKDYAYLDTPNSPINAGQQTLSIENHVFSSIKIVALNKSIGLYGLPETTNYRIYSMTGKSILDGTVNDSTYVIEANALASGIYIIELTDVNTNKVLKKKIVL